MYRKFCANLFQVISSRDFATCCILFSDFYCFLLSSKHGDLQNVHQVVSVDVIYVIIAILKKPFCLRECGKYYLV